MLIEAGERIRPQTLALLAAQGLAEIDVGGEVRAAIITTGDELVRPGGSLGAGQIYESNSTLVRALFDKCGVLIAAVEHCADDALSIEAALRRGLEYDILVIVGGVSVGARDFVKPALTSVGAQTDLWRVSVKPGKPFLFGRAGRCAIFGLPGNPVCPCRSTNRSWPKKCKTGAIAPITCAGEWLRENSRRSAVRNLTRFMA